MKKGLKGLLCLCIVFSMVGFAFSVHAKKEKPIELNFANFYRASHLVAKVFEKWGDEVEKRTDGKVKITFYHGGSLAKMPETYDMVRTGGAEIGSWLPTYQAAVFPVSVASNVPFMFNGPLQGGAGMWEFYMTSPEMQAEYSKVKPLMMFVSDIKNVHTSKKSVHTLEDLKGMRIGCGAGIDVKVLTMLGATPVQTRSLSDQYLALQRGTTDGIYYPWAILKSLKMMDLVKHHAVANMSVLPIAVAMNLNQWNSLPSDVKKVFEDLSLSASALCGTTLEKYGAGIKAELGKSGDEIYVLPPDERARWIKTVGPVLDEWKKSVKEKGYDPDNILKALKAAADKYEKTPYQADGWW